MEKIIIAMGGLLILVSTIITWINIKNKKSADESIKNLSYTTHLQRHQNKLFWQLESIAIVSFILGVIAILVIVV